MNSPLFFLPIPHRRIRESGGEETRVIMDISKIVSTFGSMDKWYTPTSLMEKIGKVASKAGKKTVYAALLLYYALLDGDVSWKDKAIVIGALGYFICPVDLIPDLVPGGLVDDGAALLYAAKSIWDNITPSVHKKARARLSDWFGTVSDIDLF